jgi:hypothetical protein
MNYDLTVYDSCGGGILGTSANGPGQPDTVNLSWSDSWGTDDKKDLYIQVAYKTGSLCGSAAQWSLTATGNTN